MLVNPKLSGVFDYFSNLDSLSIENIARFLSFQIEAHALENFVANRILYPQTIPVTKQEIEIDFSILREAVRINPRLFCTRSRSSLTVPPDFEVRFPPLIKLISTMSDVLMLNGVTRLFVKSRVGDKLAGSIVTPPPDQVENLSFVTIAGEKYTLKPYSFTHFPVETRHTELVIGTAMFDAYGGKYGIFVDLRSLKAAGNNRQ